MNDTPPAADDFGWVTFSSTAIAAAHYDSFTQRLWIVFTSDPKPYLFIGFPPAKWKAFRSAPSKGTYYSTHIRGSYKAR